MIKLPGNIASKTVVTQLKSIFARHGIPKTIVSDNGLQYASADFKNFSLTYGFKHITSSPKYPQSSGTMEQCVQMIKGRLTQAEDLYIALMEYHATLALNGYTPALLLMG